jgi:hypothetical protein
MHVCDSKRHKVVKSTSSRSILSKVTTTADKLLFATLEYLRPGLLEELSRVAEEERRPIGELVLMALRLLLANMGFQEREGALWVFRRNGIDPEELS